MSPLRRYIGGGTAQIASRAIEALSGFATVWLATRMLAVDQYGALLVAMTITGLVHVNVN